MPLPNTSVAPNARTLDLASEVKKAWGPEFHEPDVAHVWSNKREFKSTDSGDTGIYGIEVFQALLLEDSRAGLDPNEILQEDGFRVGNG